MERNTLNVYLILLGLRDEFPAERAGFEPAKPFRGLHAFQACLFNHSSISPLIISTHPLSKATANYEKIPIRNLFSAQIYTFWLTYTQYRQNKF